MQNLTFLFFKMSKKIAHFSCDLKTLNLNDGLASWSLQRQPFYVSYHCEDTFMWVITTKTHFHVSRHSKDTFFMWVITTEDIFLMRFTTKKTFLYQSKDISVCESSLQWQFYASRRHYKDIFFMWVKGSIHVTLCFRELYDTRRQKPKR